MPPRPTIYLLLLAILLGGWALRLYGLDWDQGHALHPDERYITWVAASLHLPLSLGDLFDSSETSLNPYMWPPDGRPPEERFRPFSYGHLPLYLMALAAGGDDNEARLALVGRVISALFDTLTILFTFALGRLLYDAAVGALAGAFVALTVLHVQLAHFATFDTILTCWVVAALLFLTRFTRYGRRRDALAAGLCLGCAVGAKFSAALLLVPLLITFVLRWDHPRQARRRLLFSLALSLLVALLVFTATNPFSLLQPDQFINNLRDQGAMLRGDDSFPFTRQYHATWPYLYPVEQLLRWGLGLPLGLIAFGGLLLAFWRAWRALAPAEMWVPLAWVLVYFGLVGGLHAKFMRYMLPLLPLLALFGAALLAQLKPPAGKGRVRGVILVGLVILPTLYYALAFINVYRGEHPWLRLSRWIFTHLPPGATIAYERWDHHLPLTIDQGGVIRWPGEFHQRPLDPYAPDTPQKLRVMLEDLSASDYLLIASNRLYGTTARWPSRYPLMRRYYQRLFGGALGFRLVTPPDVERHPQLGPLRLVADPFAAAGLPSPLPPEWTAATPLTLGLGRADESFIVYDHPRPLLFQNVARLSPSEMEGLFTDLLGP